MKMKSVVMALICFILLMGTAYSQIKPVITIGGNYWYAKPNIEGGLFDEYSTSAGNMIGPYLSLRFGKVSLGTAMYFGTFNYELDPNLGTVEFDFKRSDINFNLGVNVARGLTVFGALKSMKVNGENTFDWAVVGDGRGTEEFTYNQGILLGGGLSSVIAFPASPLFVFGSAAYLLGDLDFSYDALVDGASILTEKLEASYSYRLLTLTGGLGFRTPVGIIIMVGYRYDLGSFSDFDATELGFEVFDGDDHISGIFATLAYSIRTR
jgi:hypothetical protein